LIAGHVQWLLRDTLTNKKQEQPKEAQPFFGRTRDCCLAEITSFHFEDTLVFEAYLFCSSQTTKNHPQK